MIPSRPIVCLTLALFAILSPWALAADEEILALETFDDIWETIATTHFDPELNGVDWDAVRDELRPQAATAEDRSSLRGVCVDMLSRLGQSHFELLPQEMVEAGTSVSDAPGDLGIDLRLIGDELVVTAVDEKGPASIAGIRPGFALTNVGERDIRDDLRELQDLRGYTQLRKIRQIQRKLRGDVGEPKQLSFLDGEGHSRRFKLACRPDPRKRLRFHPLPPMWTRVEGRIDVVPDPLFEGERRKVGVLRFEPWIPSLMPAIEEYLDAWVDEVDAIVLDLRGNPGGVGDMARELAGFFVEGRSTLGVFRYRTWDQNFRARPSSEPFKGPVALLVDEFTGSTSEVFASGMQALGRARVFGQVTAGAALPAIQKKLPNGDYLMHAIADYIPSGGASLEGVGVVPDVLVERRRADHLEGRDVTLERARKWVLDRVRPY